MPDEQNEQQQQGQPAEPQGAPPAPQSGETPGAFAKRLAEEKAKVQQEEAQKRADLLKSLGYDSEEAATKAAADRLSEQERTSKQLSAEKARADAAEQRANELSQAAQLRDLRDGWREAWDKAGLPVSTRGDALDLAEAKGLLKLAEDGTAPDFAKLVTAFVKDRPHLTAGSAAVSNGTSHASGTTAPLADIQKAREAFNQRLGFGR